MSEKPLITTRYPFNPYFTIVVSLIVFLLMFKTSIQSGFFYSILSFSFFYILLCRNSCRVVLFKDQIYVNYFFPWEKNIILDISNLVEVDYEYSFFNYFSDKTRAGLFVFPKYCADELKLNILSYGKIEQYSLEINTRMFGFNRLVRKLSEMVK
ncbi:MAG: hypothetical protein J0M30_08175 [Chitinophagales bacterium]|nr:hypothetical protein [Chitinophagales bacterium]